MTTHLHLYTKTVHIYTVLCVEVKLYVIALRFV